MSLRGTGALAAVLLCACNPYQNFGDGEFYAGTADPGDYQAQYKGADKYTAATVFATGKESQFFFFNPTKDVDPTDLSSAPLAYVFDAQAPLSPFPVAAKCKVPRDYVFDLRKDAYRQDEQGNIFTLLPDDPSYVPVVAQAPVTSAGEECQAIKSEKTLTGGTPGAALSTDADGNGMPDGNFLAWAIVDVASDFEPHDVNFVGPSEHFGWYNRFLVAYVDGGYIPTTTDQDGNPVAVTQILYVPDQVDADGMDITAPGSGGDVVEHARGEAGYSPICEIRTFTANPANPPKSVADVMDPMKATLDAAPMKPVYVYCLGVQQ